MPNPTKYFSLQSLEAIGAGDEKNSYALQSNLSIALGQALAAVTAASQNEIQQITAPGSGNYTLSCLGQTTGPIAHGAADSTVQAALQGLSTIGSGNCTVASLAVTFTGAMANLPQPLLSDPTGAATVSRTQVGRSQYYLAPYSSTLIANPTTAPSLTAAGSDGTWAVGAYSVCYTWVTAQGESVPSYEGSIALASTNHIAVASITSIPANVASVNVYVNGLFAKNVSVSNAATGAFTITGPASATAAAPPPRISTAYLNNDGTQTFVGLAAFAVTTNQFGQISPGTSSGDEQGSFLDGMPVFVKGRFNAADLSGLDAAGLTGHGSVEQGSLAAGVVRLY